jgi:1-acyl-sn-glycerol-3-phosphate acyltransferase
VIYVLRYLLVVLYTVFWATLAMGVAVVDRSGLGVLWVGRQWVRWICATCGIRIEAEGLGGLERGRSYVFMTNHQSAVDIAAIVATLPGDWRFVAKRELTWIPFFGWALALHRHVIVDRRNNARAVASMKRAAERIRSGTSVIIFPEGTRSLTGELLPFKSGGFHLAIQSQVPIVPATISGSQHITPKRSLRILSGTVKIRYGEPIPTVGLGVEDRHALQERVRSAIQRGYDLELQDGAGVRDPEHGPRRGASAARPS